MCLRRHEPHPPWRGTLIHIQYAPECRLIVEDEGRHLRIEAPSKTSEASPPSASPEGDLTERIIALAQSKLGDRYQPARWNPVPYLSI